MQSAETVLGVLRERGRMGLPCSELYRQLFNPQMYLLAYGRSTNTRPGSCAVCGAVRWANAADSCPVNVIVSATSASSRAPTCDTTPVPSAETSTGGRLRVACTWKVPSCLRL